MGSGGSGRGRSVRTWEDGGLGGHETCWRWYWSVGAEMGDVIICRTNKLEDLLERMRESSTSRGVESLVCR